MPTKLVLARKKKDVTLAVFSFCLDVVILGPTRSVRSTYGKTLRRRSPKPLLKIIVFIDGPGHINSTPVRTLVEGFVKAVKSHSDLEVVVRSAMVTTTRDEEISSTLAQLIKAEECVQAAVKRKATLEKRFVGLPTQISEFVKAETTLEASLKDSAITMDEMSAEVVNLKKIMSSLEERRVVSDVDLQSLSERLILVEKT